MKDVTIIDQAVPKSIQDILENITRGDKMNWFRQERATYGDNAPGVFPVTPTSRDLPQFTHTIYEIDKPVSQLFHVLLPVITAIPYTVKQLIRIKMNLGVYTLLDNPEVHGMPHVDFTKVAEPLLTAIYYVNDSSGDTIIFDQRFGASGPLTIKQRVPHKKGRLVVFDGRLLHAGNTPRDNTPRININFNAFIYEGAKAD
ncbi:MAG: hypothetical protein FJY37_02315 [Betaproteobacteria bacterium]|nr:hypothetical protein [Betaproteobacteria bacterium]